VVDIRERVLPEMRKVLSAERYSRRHSNCNGEEKRYHHSCSNDSGSNDSGGSDDVQSINNFNRSYDKSKSSCNDVTTNYHNINYDNTKDCKTKDNHHVRDDIHDDHNNGDDDDEVDLIVVIICGLNDWKEVFLRFPYNYNYGPSSFKNHLTNLIDDVRTMSDQLNYKCKIYLPTVPSGLLSSDPNFSLNVKPLWYFVQFFSNLWDLQKQHIAFDDKMVRW